MTTLRSPFLNPMKGMLGSAFGLARAAAKLQALLNGFTGIVGNTYTSGALWEPDYEGTLVSGGADVPSIPGMRLSRNTDEGASGTELVTNVADREFSSDTGYWTNQGIIADGVNTFTSKSDYICYKIGLLTDLSNTYIQVTYTIKEITSGSVQAYAISGNFGTARTAPGTYTEVLLTPASGSVSGGLYGTSFTGVIDDLSIQRITSPVWINDDGADTALYPTRTVSTVNDGSVTQYGGTYKGKSVYPARTNILLQSNDLNTTWLTIGSPLKTKDVVGPDGVANSAWSVGNLTTSSSIRQEQAATTGAVYTPSFYVKQNPSYTTGTVLLINPRGSVSGSWSIDLSQLSSTEWERLTVDHPSVTVNNTFVGASSLCGIYLQGIDATAAGLLFYGAQLEVGAFPTPYILTTDTTVTRAATVDSYTSEGRLRANDWAVWLRRYVTAAGQTAWALNSYTDASNETGLQFLPTSLLFRKRVATVDVDLPLTFTHIANYNDVQIAQTEHGMLMRASDDEGATWTAWAENTSATDAVMATTVQNGRDSDIPLACGATFTGTLFLPTFADIAAAKTYLETANNWASIGEAI